METPKKKKTIYSFKTKSLKGLDKVLAHMSSNSSFCDILYKEYNLNANKRNGGKTIAVDIYTDSQRKKLHRALKKYGMSKDDLFKLFDKEHITDLKNENENSTYMRNRKINEAKNDVIEVSIDTIESAGLETQSVAKVLGTLYHDKYEEGDSEFDLDEFYDYTTDNWDGVIDAYDKANEAEADEEGLEEAEYELDEPMSDGSVGLDELGVVDADTLGQLITELSTESDLHQLVKDESEDEPDDEWEDRTKLDGNDALESFSALVDALEDSITDDEVDPADTESEVANDVPEDFIDEAIREGYKFSKVEDIINEAKEEGRRQAMLEAKKEVTVGKTTKEVEVAKADVKALKDADKLKEVLKSNLAAIKSLVSAAKIDAKVPSMKDATVENLQALKEVVSDSECKAKGDICKAIEVAKACVTALEKIKNKGKKDNNSVTAQFVKYRKMFEGEDTASADDDNKDSDNDDDNSDNAAGADDTADTADDTKDPKDGDDKEDEEIELSGIRVFVEKGEDGGDDYADKFKQALIDFGVAEEDITEEDSDDENQTVFVVDGNSCEKLIEFGQEHDFDFEEALDADADSDSDDEDDKKEDGEDEGDDSKEGDDDSSADSDAEIDAMWDDIFGTGADSEGDIKE